MNYDSFASTFSRSRIDHPWPELEYIIEDMKQHGRDTILDIGCGNGRFLGEAEKGGLKIQSYLGTDNSLGMIEAARSLYPSHSFSVCPMEELASLLESGGAYDAIVFLASYHHLDTEKKRIETLTQVKKSLAPHGRIYMTNWNLRDQPKYETMKKEKGEYHIKIGEFFRYYHGFTLDELEGLFSKAGYKIEEHRIFEGGRNLLSILSLPQ